MLFYWNSIDRDIVRRNNRINVSPSASYLYLSD